MTVRITITHDNPGVPTSIVVTSYNRSKDAKGAWVQGKPIASVIVPPGGFHTATIWKETMLVVDELASPIYPVHNEPVPHL